AERDLLEELPSLVRAAALEDLVAEFDPEPGELVVDHAPDLVPREVAVPDPLPHLRARDLRGRRILHQVVDRHGAAAAQPGRQILDPDADVIAEPLLRDLA